MLETKYLMISGELHFVKPADSSDVDGGKYDVVVRATDGGKPPLFNDVKVRGEKVRTNMFMCAFTHTMTFSNFDNFPLMNCLR